MLEAYKRAGLIPLLESMREPGRYKGVEDLNVLTNCVDTPDYDQDEVKRELAALASGERKVPKFSREGQGFSIGLNPYTDWTLSQIDDAPDHAYLFLGVDWDTITSLGTPEEWLAFSRDPFAQSYSQSGKKVVDRYWHNVWAWIMNKTRPTMERKEVWATPIAADEAAAFIRSDNGAFIFHNLIPYLRPAGEKKSGTKWYYEQWKDKNIQNNIIEDLCRLRECFSSKRVFAFCTSAYVRDALRRACFPSEMTCCWSAHPSRVFHPTVMHVKRKIMFRGLHHFAALR